MTRLIQCPISLRAKHPIYCRLNRVIRNFLVNYWTIPLVSRIHSLCSNRGNIPEVPSRNWWKPQRPQSSCPLSWLRFEPSVSRIEVRRVNAWAYLISILVLAGWSVSLAVMSSHNIVTYRPTARQRLGKHNPAEGKPARQQDVNC
jgi:hypothetical protein